MFYEYKCPSCGKVFEIEKKISDVFSKERCPECGQLAKRIISGGNGFILRGSWPGKDGK